MNPSLMTEIDCTTGDSPDHEETRSTGVDSEEMRSESPEPPDLADRPLTVVGIGASAGGLAALVKLVGRLEPDAGLAYVLVQHLDPSQPSMLPEILARTTRVPVVAAVDGIRLEADHAYVIPPNSGMTVVDGHLRVVERSRARGVHTVIDTFFESLSDVYDGSSIGVILSGAGSDGARGIEAIKSRGGLTFAQDAHTAQFPSMPESAVATGCVDFVLPPEEIAEELMQVGQLSRGPGGRGEAEARDRESLEKILQLLRSRTEVDFRQYRRATVDRRILRRMLAHRNTTHVEYLDTVRASPGELDILCEDLLIGVTRFFRDPETFKVLEERGFAELLKSREVGTPIRVWVAGCSGGEEAYSIGMVLLEQLGESEADTELQLFATDLSEAAVSRARTGMYPHSIEADVAPERLQRFFVREDTGYRVTRRLRDVCVFAKHNLVRDPPFSRIDLVSCRNVLIYFDAPLQQRAMQVFHYALREGGLLLLGGAESAAAELFAPIDKRHKLFIRRPGSDRIPEATDAFARRDAAGRVGAIPAREHDTPRLGEGARSANWQHRTLDRLPANETHEAADRAILDRLAPAGVVINERLEIVQFRGDTTSFIQHAPGAATLHLLKLVRAEVLPRLRAAIEQASADARPVREAGIRVRDGDAMSAMTLEVIPFRMRSTRQRHFVVLFSVDAEPVLLAPRVRHVAPQAAPQAAPRPALHPARGDGDSTREPHRDADRPEGDARSRDDMTREIAALREELSDAKQTLQDVIEQYEAANEELRAASEEIQSSNEELHSTNEELETTKEEVQSTNEELTTVNEELRHRNRELAAVSADLANVLTSTQIPMLIVDTKLVIRRFTPATDHVIKLIPGDVGRPLGDLKLRFDLPELEQRVSACIESLASFQVDVRDDEDHWWGLSIRPYLTTERKVDGALLVFANIDASKKFGEAAAAASEVTSRLLIDAEEARAEATTANLAKMSFLANMSHDLRTPLNAIGGYVDLLELGIHGPMTTEQMDALARVKRSARHLLSLINDVLNFAKAETGQLDLRIAPTSIPSALASLEELVLLQARTKQLSFETCDCDYTVLADPDKLQQVLLNLATNAIKFTESGGVTVRCAATASTVSVTIADTGRGIPADQLERVFEPFVQVGRSLTNVNHDGVGLGLAISRDLARAMGGDISVTSDVGKGSAFTVTLPRAS